MTDVLVVGAGPTGLTLACVLARQGVSVRIVDRSPSAQPGSRGFTVKPRTLEVFDDLGIADRFMAAGWVAARTRVHLGGSLLADFSIGQDKPSATRPYPNSLALPQFKTEEILRDRLADFGVRVEFGTGVRDFQANAGGVVVELDTGESAQVSYLVGCDGGRSTVRKRLGLRFSGRTEEDVQVLLADAYVEGLAHSNATQIWLGADTFVARPSGEGGRWQLVASVPPDHPEPSARLLEKLARERTGLDLRLVDPNWLSVWRYHLRMVDTYRVGPVFLAGDAAHVHSPFGAFGMNTGVQDADNLGWKLGWVLRGHADDGLLDTYEQERLPVARAVLAESDRTFSTAARPPAFLRPLLPLLVRPYLTRLNKRGRYDHPSYPDSSLSVGPGAGVSAPDGRYGTGRLFDLYRGSHLTVLAFGQPLDQFALYGPAVRGYSVDSADIRRAYGVRPGTFVVIRPDGYIGAVVREVADLTAYLDRTLSLHLVDR
ncbi:FAD-dependent oxidoreductase [Fodinicola feengrottensis]|uniref:FAD-dependent oxidoreductase n=1 Tax=Fodinicola feengrottensis TaxID=435914 RepID=A0ABP4TUC6_9ACTN